MGRKSTVDEAQWLDARVRWESDPEITYSSIARTLGVDQSCVQRHATRDGWTKVGLAKIAPEKRPDPASEAEFLANREKVKHNHRAEWVHHRTQFGVKDLAVGGFDDCKKAKIIAEMLTIRQLGERKAWAIDDQATDGKPVVVEWAD